MLSNTAGRPSASWLLDLLKKRYFFNNESLRSSVEVWCSNREVAEERFGHISTWDTSKITDMKELFKGSVSLDDDISGWDVSNVTDMSFMFEGASSFNQPLDRWDVNIVTDMRKMFARASSFNQPLVRWNVSNLTDMSWMFAGASSFNQPLDTLSNG